MSASDRNAQLLATAVEEGLISPVMSFAHLCAVPLTNLQDRDTALAEATRHRLNRTSKLAMAELLEGLGDRPKNAELAEAVARGVPRSLIEEALQQGQGFEALATAFRNEAIETSAPPACLAPDQIDADALNEIRRAGVGAFVNRADLLAPACSALAIDVSRFITPDGLEIDVLDDLLSAALENHARGSGRIQLRVIDRQANKRVLLRVLEDSPLPPDFSLIFGHLDPLGQPLSS